VVLFLLIKLNKQNTKEKEETIPAKHKKNIEIININSFVF
jgi:hypothetical protein